MISPQDPYRPFLDDVVTTPSDVAVYLPPYAPRPDLVALAERLAADDRVQSLTEVEGPSDQDEGAFEFTYGLGERRLEFVVSLHEAEPDFRDEPDLAPAREAEANRSEWCLTVSTYLRDEVLDDFHTLLKLAHRIAPNAVAVYDYATYRVHDGDWLREIATSRVPPPPDTLYAVHCVTDPDSDETWLHSHGLHRCGCIELEMFDVPRDEISMYSSLFHVAASLLIERGTPPPQDPFEVGRDLILFWMPWEDAIARSREGSLGRSEDRDEYHDKPSGVLFADVPERSADLPPAPVSVFQPILGGEPVMFHTHMETRRMSLMAKERFPRFRTIQRRFREDTDWLFHAKLGYQVDGCRDDDDDNEHLWFDVHDIRRGELDATLLNEPFHIARMRAGDRRSHPIDQLSDWTIDCPHGVFDPSNIGQLEERLQL